MARRPPRLNRFSRSMRLQQGAEFKRLKEQGKRVFNGCLILNWMNSPDAKTTRLGIITTRRIGGAVVRNRARRLLRESFRRNRDVINGIVDMVLVARASIREMSQREVDRDFLGALRRAHLLKRA